MNSLLGLFFLVLALSALEVTSENMIPTCNKPYENVGTGQLVVHGASGVKVPADFIKIIDRAVAMDSPNYIEGSTYMSFESLLRITLTVHLQDTLYPTLDYSGHHSDVSSFLRYVEHLDHYWLLPERRAGYFVTGSLSMEHKEKFGYRLHVIIKFHVGTDCSVNYFVEYYEGNVEPVSEEDVKKEFQSTSFPRLKDRCSGKVEYINIGKFETPKPIDNIKLLCAFERAFLKFMKTDLPTDESDKNCVLRFRQSIMILPGC